MDDLNNESAKELAQATVEALLAQDKVSPEFTGGVIAGLIVAASDNHEARQEFINAFFYTQASRATKAYKEVSALSQHVIESLGIKPEELSAAEAAIKAENESPGTGQES